ncbi:hypothetical protein [Veillonella agrestimuris]|uniref:hypothetical protein n=1 Tax=Veillonella agrestimuris TaxID=2941340 RepID=UPI00203B3DAB|nr:hypothetical protein [Veillonella agrestimuris]
MKSKTSKSIIMLCFGAFIASSVIAPAAAATIGPSYSSSSRYHKKSDSDYQKRIEKERKEREKRYEEDRKKREEERKEREKNRKKYFWDRYDSKNRAERSRAHMGADPSH